MTKVVTRLTEVVTRLTEVLVRVLTERSLRGRVEKTRDSRASGPAATSPPCKWRPKRLTDAAGLHTSASSGPAATCSPSAASFPGRKGLQEAELTPQAAGHQPRRKVNLNMLKSVLSAPTARALAGAPSAASASMLRTATL